MIIHLNVPYAEKDQAKALGAKWNPNRKTWYIENMENLDPFIKWIPEPLLRPHRRVDNDPRFANNSIGRGRNKSATVKPAELLLEEVHMT